MLYKDLNADCFLLFLGKSSKITDFFFFFLMSSSMRYKFDAISDPLHLQMREITKFRSYFKFIQYFGYLYASHLFACDDSLLQKYCCL